MTEKEAIKELEWLRNIRLLRLSLKEATKIAIEALEKQIPKKANNIKAREQGGYYNSIHLRTGFCPNCNNPVSEVNSICDCGQMLDWNENE